VQAHTFSDDAIFAMTGKKGIARTKIAFTLKKGDTSEIVMADYDGHNQIQLTQDGSIVAAPTWAPGAHVIYYTSYMKNNPDIYSQDLRTGARKAIARFSGLNSSAAISPDGQHIAMILSKDGSPDVYVANVDGSNLRRLTSTREDESSPCWSPDGQKLCFASRATAVPRLYTISVNGGQPTRIQTAGVNSATEPDWSPDGKTITFTTTTGGFNVCVVPATGGQVDILAPGMDSVWASNSRTIIFNRKNGGKSVLSLLDVPSKQVKDIPQVSGSASQPSWAR
jgi:TolB protein